MHVLATTGDGTAVPIDAPMPSPGPRVVLVRVEAATINYVDRFVTSGATRELGLIIHDGPVGLGWDAVGRVESVGFDVRTVTVGDRVAGVRVADDSVYGAIAEYVVLPEAEVALVPNPRRHGVTRTSRRHPAISFRRRRPRPLDRSTLAEFVRT